MFIPIRNAKCGDGLVFEAYQDISRKSIILFKNFTLKVLSQTANGRQGALPCEALRDGGQASKGADFSGIPDFVTSTQ